MTGCEAAGRLVLLVTNPRPGGRGSVAMRPGSRRGPVAGFQRGAPLWARDMFQNAERFCKHIRRAYLFNASRQHSTASVESLSMRVELVYKQWLERSNHVKNMLKQG